MFQHPDDLYRIGSTEHAQRLAIAERERAARRLPAGRTRGAPTRLLRRRPRPARVE